MIREISEKEYEKLKDHSHTPLPSEKAQEVYDKYGLIIHDGFLMFNPSNSTYLAYGKKNYGTPHYYYLGQAMPPVPFNGDYYCFDSADADADGLVPVSRFSCDMEAIRYAKEKEASLYREFWENNCRTECKLLYEPWACFAEAAV